MTMALMMTTMSMMMMLMVMEFRPRVDWLWRSYRRILDKLSKERRHVIIIIIVLVIIIIILIALDHILVVIIMIAKGLLIMIYGDDFCQYWLILNFHSHFEVQDLWFVVYLVNCMSGTPFL